MMKKISLVTLLAGSLLALPAAADPWDGHKGGKHHGRHKGEREYEYSDGNCKIKRKWKKGEYEEEIKCKDSEHGHGHYHEDDEDDGYDRRNYSRRYREQPSYSWHDIPLPFGEETPHVRVRCEEQPILATVIGSNAGLLLGNQFGSQLVGQDPNMQMLATVGATLLGAFLGEKIDSDNRECITQSLEYARPNTQVIWSDRSGNAYGVLPGKIRRENGLYCRSFKIKHGPHDRLNSRSGKACRKPDGHWIVMR